jgi:hypothetical protein
MNNPMEGMSYNNRKFSENDLVHLSIELNKNDYNDRAGIIFDFLNKQGYGTDPKAVEELTKNLKGITLEDLKNRLEEIARPN